MSYSEDYLPLGVYFTLQKIDIYVFELIYALSCIQLEVTCTNT